MLSQAQTNLLREGAKIVGSPLSNEEVARFSLYLEEISRWSKVTDLVSQDDPEAIIRKHLLDSLAVLSFLPSGTHLLDLGSGAGFPGLVLAICRPSLEILLVEARRKRANFLKDVARKAGLRNVKVYDGRAEALSRDESCKESFDLVITRATWSLKDFLRIASPFTTCGGMVIAMKGPRIEREFSDLEPILRKGEFQLKERYEYALPFGNEKRQVIFFTKQCFT